MMTAETIRPLFGRRENAAWLTPFAGERVAFHLAGPQTAQAFSVGEAVIEPLVGPPLHIHHDADEFLYVLEGAIDFEIEGGRFQAQAGGFAFIPRGMKHAFRNFGRTPARLLGVISPSGFDEFFAAMDGRPLSDLPGIAARYRLEIVGPQLEPVA